MISINFKLKIDLFLTLISSLLQPVLLPWIVLSVSSSGWFVDSGWVRVEGTGSLIHHSYLISAFLERKALSSPSYFFFITSISLLISLIITIESICCLSDASSSTTLFVWCLLFYYVVRLMPPLLLRCSSDASSFTALLVMCLVVTLGIKETLAPPHDGCQNISTKPVGTLMSLTLGSSYHSCL